MNKKKRIIGIMILIALAIIVIGAGWIIYDYKKKKVNPNIEYFEGEESVENIEWMGVAEDGISTCIVKYGGKPYYYSIVPGKYIILDAVKGSREYVYGGKSGTFLGENLEYERFELYTYNIETGETRMFFDGVEYMEQHPDIQFVMDANCAVIGGENVYQRGYEQRPQDKIVEMNIDYLCINVEDGSYSVQDKKAARWSTYTTGVFNCIEDDRLLSNNLPEGMLEEIIEYCLFYSQPYQNYEGVFYVRGFAKYLPEHNEVLYGMFPELEQYRGEEDCYVYLLIGGNPTAEELLRLFMEDGQEISFEGVVLPGLWSIDGEDHEIHSFEEYEQWISYD